MSLAGLPSNPSPGEMLAWIQARFRDWGILGQNLTVTHRQQPYLVSCTSEAFTIYRLVTRCHIPPGAPGWPVCLVTAETIIDETGPPHLEADEFSSGLTLPEWLELLESLFGES